MDVTADASEPAWWVACLCAEWCGVCREWEPVFLEQARANPGKRFAWVDVEDEHEAMGDVDIETFPTLLIARGDELLFLGPVPPSASQLARMLAALQAQPIASSALTDSQRALFERLRHDVLPHATV